MDEGTQDTQARPGGSGGGDRDVVAVSRSGPDSGRTARHAAAGAASLGGAHFWVCGGSSRDPRCFVRRDGRVPGNGGLGGGAIRLALRAPPGADRGDGRSWLLAGRSGGGTVKAGAPGRCLRAAAAAPGTDDGGDRDGARNASEAEGLRGGGTRDASLHDGARGAQGGGVDAHF